VLTHPTLDKIIALKLWGMDKALEDQRRMPDIESLTFEERLGLLVDRESTERKNRKLQVRLKKARLRLAACLEDLDFRQPRGLDKDLLLELGSCRWIADHQNVLLTGPMGVGKSFLACALGQKACREGFRTLYFWLSRLREHLIMPSRLSPIVPKAPITLARSIG
jgi:DNA replication protein DnaC